MRIAATACESDPGELTKFREEVRLVYIAWLPFVGLVAGALLALTITQGKDVRSTVALAILTASLVVVNGHQKLWASLLRGFGNVRVAALLEGVQGGTLVLSTQIIILALAAVLLDQLSLELMIVGLVAGFLPAILLAGRRVNTLWHGARQRLRLGRLWVIGLKNWGFASSQIAAFVALSVEIWLAALVLQPSELSAFGAAQRLSVTVAAPLAAFQVVMSPTIARLYYSKQAQRLSDVTRGGAAIAFLLGLPLLMPLLLFPEQTIRLVFGSGYSSGAPLLAILTFGSFLNLATGMSSAVLSMTGGERVLANVQWLFIAIRTVSGMVSALLFGAVGLATSSAVLTGLTWVVLMACAKRTAGVWTAPGRLAHVRKLRRMTV